MHSRSMAAAAASVALALAIHAGGAIAPARAQESGAQARANAPPEGSVGGMGDVNLYPKRVVIDARARIATVGLYNRSVAAGEYQISIEDKIMLPDGSVVAPETVDDPALRARARGASSMLRWSPRRITLLGNEAQTVRIMARTPPDLPPGEYRAHFLALSVPPVAGAADSIERAAGGGGARPSIGVTIVPRFGISIPVILRVGETTLSAGIRDVAMETTPDGARVLALTLTRSGTRSAFGDIRVTRAGSKGNLALVRGLGVYTELDGRRVAVPLPPEAETGPLPHGTRLTLTYADDDAEPGKVLATSEFVVP